MTLPRDPIHRRRLTVLAACAAMAAVSGAWVGAGAGEDRARRAAGPDGAGPGDGLAPSGPGDGSTSRADGASAPSTATLRREAGQTIVMRFAGTSAPPYVLRALRERRAAGVILFRDNVRSRGQLRAMSRAIQRAAGGRALIMTDQEGGEIRNVPWGAPVSPPSRVHSTSAATAVAKATARDLTAAGVNVDLAPVADVGTWPGSVVRDRAFPGSGRDVGRLVAATVRAYQAAGVRATVKHFPGLGRSTANTDFRPATVPGVGDLPPFQAGIDAGSSLVMASHALHPALDRHRIASQSSKILEDLLRDRMGFKGACITDALEAQAVVQRSSITTAALRSMRAGCDLLLTSVPGSYGPILQVLTDRARKDPALRARLREARGRITPLLPS